MMLDKEYEGTNNGTSDAEFYDIDSISGRYLKLSFTESSSKEGWVSVKEIVAYAYQATQ